jgi:ABC-2 type transport system permease protein
MTNSTIIMRRELASYFATPLAYVFILIFLVLVNFFAFFFGALYERGQADLQSFFTYHPWIYVFLISAVSMRLWAEERHSGSIELLMTQPVTLWEAVWGKFLAAWAFVAISLVLTFPIWITINYLGKPDNGIIAAAYIGSLMMAGGFLAIGSCMSALTRSQVIAFIVTAVVSLVFVLLGMLPGMVNNMPDWVQSAASAIASMSIYTHFTAISKGVVDIRDVLYFAMLIGLFLLATSIALDVRKAE